MGIPARYVSGLRRGQFAARADFHGFFEAYLHDRWFLFDATRLARSAVSSASATGRCAADIRVANIRGEATGTSVEVWPNEQKVDSIDSGSDKRFELPVEFRLGQVPVMPNLQTARFSRDESWEIWLVGLAKKLVPGFLFAPCSLSDRNVSF